MPSVVGLCNTALEDVLCGCDEQSTDSADLATVFEVCCAGHAGAALGRHGGETIAACCDSIWEIWPEICGLRVT